MPGAVIAVIIIVGCFIFYRIRKCSTLNVERLEGRRCIWCEKPIEEDQAYINKSIFFQRYPNCRFRSHLTCEERVLARHRMYYRVILGMVVMTTIMASIGTLSDLKHGYKLGWDDLSLFIKVFASVFAVLMFIRSKIRPWEEEVKRAKEQLIP